MSNHRKNKAVETFSPGSWGREGFRLGIAFNYRWPCPVRDRILVESDALPNDLVPLGT